MSILIAMSILNFTQWKLNESDESLNKNDVNKIIELAGYSKGSAPYVIASIITKKEGWSAKPNSGKGTRAWRNNNPGNLDFQENFKQLDPNVKVETLLDGKPGRYAEFSTPELGMKALIQYKVLKWANGGMPITSSNQELIITSKGGPKYVKGQAPTIAQFFYTYAPPNQNDTESYIKMFINEVKVLKKDVTRDTLFKDLLAN